MIKTRNMIFAAILLILIGAGFLFYHANQAKQSDTFIPLSEYNERFSKEGHGKLARIIIPKARKDFHHANQRI